MSLFIEVLTSEIQSAASAVAILQVEPEAEHIISIDAPKKDQFAELVRTHSLTLAEVSLLLCGDGTMGDAAAAKVSVEKREMNRSFIKMFLG
jgi:hypothetical protein